MNIQRFQRKFARMLADVDKKFGLNRSEIET